MRQMGRPRQESTAIQIPVSVCVTEDDRDALDRIAALEKVGRSTLMRRALRHYITSLEKSNATVTVA